jgi:hypothetical protein
MKVWSSYIFDTLGEIGIAIGIKTRDNRGLFDLQ